MERKELKGMMGQKNRNLGSNFQNVVCEVVKPKKRK